MRGRSCELIFASVEVLPSVAAGPPTQSCAGERTRCSPREARLVRRRVTTGNRDGAHQGPRRVRKRNGAERSNLEAFSKLAETSRRSTGSAIGEPEQSFPPGYPFRPVGAPELLCGGAVVITEQAAQSLTTSHLPVGTADALFRLGQHVPEPLMVALPNYNDTDARQTAYNRVYNRTEFGLGSGVPSLGCCTRVSALCRPRKTESAASLVGRCGGCQGIS